MIECIVLSSVMCLNMYGTEQVFVIFTYFKTSLHIIGTHFGGAGDMVAPAGWRGKATPMWRLMKGIHIILFNLRL